MFEEKFLFMIYTQTPIHVGSGTSVSYIDMPVQREKHTDYPIISSSGIKGVIRDLAVRKDELKEHVEIIFGPEGKDKKQNDEDFASCISFSDGKILCYPVRSLKGVFAYITCPYVLKRFKRDVESLGIQFTEIELPEIKDSEVLLCHESELKIDTNTNQVAFEEFVFDVIQGNAEKVASELEKYLPNNLPTDFTQHFAIVSDNVFRDFTKYSVDIRTRIRINQATGTVDEGALFTMEFIPSESIFYSQILIAKPRKNNAGITVLEVKEKINNLLNEKVVQFGGDETLGMGLVKIKLI